MVYPSSLALGEVANPRKTKKRLIESQDIFVVQAADLHTNPALRDDGDLVHHQPAGRDQSVAVIRVRRAGGTRALLVSSLVTAQILIESVASKP
jgi:hypothetical protein